jgi:5S rRNA maturation endonuclease (ribonuclease M5)
VSAGDDGRVLVHCHGGCTQEAVIDALRARGLWHEGGYPTKAMRVISGGLDFNNVPSQPENKRIAATFDYTDPNGTLLYQVVKYDPKDFRQRRPDGNGGWIRDLKGVQRVLYRLPELLKYPEGTLFACEGEKDADRIASLGYCATTVASGTWTGIDLTPVAGRDVIVLEDADKAGVKKALQTATSLHPVAKSVRIVRLPGQEFTAESNGKDVSDWLDADSANAQRFVDVCFAAPLWEPERTRLSG